MVEEMIPIVMFLSLAVVFVALFWFRYRSRRDMQETFRAALDKGQELTPDIIDRLGHPKVSKDKDLRLGVIWMAIALGLVLMAFVVPDPSGHSFRGILAGAAFPVAIGIAYLVLYGFTDRGK